MYESYFKLNALPFQITPDVEFLYISKGHRSALNTIIFALESGEGLLKVVGEVGLGKSLLCRQILSILAENNEYITAYIPNPNLSADAFLILLLEEFGLDSGLLSENKMFLWNKTLNYFLIKNAKAGKKMILLIDEAQAMPLATLEAVRLLSNLETSKRKLLQIVLFGQPELDSSLARPEVRQILQRVTFHARLTPLQHSELRYYIDARLQQAGAGYMGNIFTDQAVKLLWLSSKGTPRLVNILCHKSMLVAYGENAEKISKKHMLSAIEDTDGVPKPTLWQRWFA